jgi:hypothetical protein
MKLKIGKTSYKVQMVDTLAPKLSRGRITYKPVNTIQVTTYAHGKPRSVKAMQHTFWHEAVHGMLYEMGSTKYRDEAFVDDLARLIQQVNAQAAKMDTKTFYDYINN